MKPPKDSLMNETAGPRPAKLIKATGEVLAVLPENGTDFKLEELNRFVGGYIEVIYPPHQDGKIMIINEEGKLKGLPYNAAATAIWTHDNIVGNALLCESDQVK